MAILLLVSSVASVDHSAEPDHRRRLRSAQGPHAGHRDRHGARGARGQAVARHQDLRRVPELTQKPTPARSTWPSSGTGTISHLAGGVADAAKTGIKVMHVPYRGAPPAVTDLLGGHADIMFSDAPFFLEHIKAGKLIPLAVGTPQRASARCRTCRPRRSLAIRRSSRPTPTACSRPPKTPPEIVEQAQSACARRCCAIPRCARLRQAGSHARRRHAGALPRTGSGPNPIAGFRSSRQPA